MKQFLGALITVLFSSVCFAVLAWAEIYRWVDEDGNVQFSDQKPADREDSAEAVELGQPALVIEADDVEELNERQALLQAQQQADRRLQAPLAATNNAAAQQRCRDARIGIVMLDQGMAVYWSEEDELRLGGAGDTYRGKRRYVAEEDRPALEANFWQDVRRYCPDPNNQQAFVDDYNQWVDEEWCETHRVQLEQVRKAGSRTPSGEIEKIATRYAQQCG